MDTLLGLWGAVKLLLGSCVGLLIFLYLWDWYRARKRSWIHRRALQKISTEEIESRARTLPYLERHADTEAVKEVQSLLAQRRYEDLQRRWSHHENELSKVGDNRSAWAAEFHDSATGQILHDYLVVLRKRQKVAAGGNG
jgi:hypothetical protein